MNKKFKVDIIQITCWKNTWKQNLNWQTDLKVVPEHIFKKGIWAANYLFFTCWEIVTHGILWFRKLCPGVCLWPVLLHWEGSIECQPKHLEDLAGHEFFDNSKSYLRDIFFTYQVWVHETIDAPIFNWVGVDRFAASIPRCVVLTISRWMQTQGHLQGMLVCHL